jgi:hypothetical protein
MGCIRYYRGRVARTIRGRLCNWETTVLLRSTRVPLSAQTQFSIYIWWMGI